MHVCEPFYETSRGVFVCLHASDINSRSCQWPLTGPVALSVSALMLGQGRRSEHRMSLQRLSLTHTHAHTHSCSKLMTTPSRPPAPSSVPRPQELPCQLPDYKEPKHSAEGGNSSWWQPCIVATPQAAQTTSGCMCARVCVCACVCVCAYCKLPVFICFEKSTAVPVFYLSTLCRCQRLKSLRHKIWLFRKTSVYSIKIST